MRRRAFLYGRLGAPAGCTQTASDRRAAVPSTAPTGEFTASDGSIVRRPSPSPARAPLLVLLLAVTGCTINPVTGQRELALVSAADEVAIGEAQYFPSRQMQGGDYVRDPALNDYVQRVGQRLAAVGDRSLLPYEFVVLNNSVPNAWALPGGKIAINRGLLVELDSEAELAAVLGHEIVHAAARHGALAMQRQLLLQGAVLVAATATRDGDFSGLAVGAASLGAGLINMRNSREAELESDRFGMQYMARAGYDPRAAISLQETFLRLSQGRPGQGWLAGLFASHPPSAERVAANRATAATLPATGETGRDRYQSAIASLLRSKPAYDSFDSGRAALARGELAQAQTSAREALRLVDDEGHFHALLGDVELARGDAVEAITHFDDALARNAEYFYYRLRKAQAYQRLRRWTDAEAEYAASISLLPTADAYLGLGRIAEQRGDRAGAIAQYRRAAESSGGAGDAAREAIVRLDLPANPGQYIALGTSLDSAGRVQVAVQNPTRYAVADLRILVRYVDSQGRASEQRRTITGPLPAGESRRFATDIGPFSSGQTYEAAIESARVIDE